MPRVTRKVFVDLAIWMMAFGVSIGIVFPFFVILLGTPPGSRCAPCSTRPCLAAMM